MNGKKGLSTISKNGLKIGDVVYMEQECRKYVLTTSKAFAVQFSTMHPWPHHAAAPCVVH